MISKASFIRSDLPTTTDYLDIDSYVEALTRFTLTCQTPMAIGIQGEWGSGKSSFMKMIQDRLSHPEEQRYHNENVPFVPYMAENIFYSGRSRRAPKELPVKIFSFETWQFGVVKPELLGFRVLQTLCNQLEQELSKSQEEDGLLSNAMQFGMELLKGVKELTPMVARGIERASYGIVESEFVSQMFDGDSNTRLRHKDELIIHLKGLFNKFIKQSCEELQCSRFILFIDDLDRIQPLHAVMMLEVLKNFMDVPGCVFVLACDYEVIREGVRQKFGITDERKALAFFDKIIQVPFDVPVAQYDIRRLLQEYLKNKNAALPPVYRGKSYQQWRDFDKIIAPMISLAVGRNPRAFKRFLNILDLLSLVAQTNELTRSGRRLDIWEDTNKWVSLVILVALQIKWPTISNWLISNVEQTIIASRINMLLGIKNADEDEGYDEEIMREFRNVLETEQSRSLTPEESERVTEHITIQELISFFQGLLHFFDKKTVNNVLEANEVKDFASVAGLLSVTSRGKANAQKTGLDGLISSLQEIENREVRVLCLSILNELQVLRKQYRRSASMQAFPTHVYYKYKDPITQKDTLFLKMTSSGSIVVYTSGAFEVFEKFQSVWHGHSIRKERNGRPFFVFTFEYLQKKENMGLHSHLSKWILGLSQTLWSESLAQEEIIKKRMLQKAMESDQIALSGEFDTSGQ